MATKFKPGEYTLNGKTYKLTGAQMQAMAVMTMPELETRFKGVAVTGMYTALPEYYQGRQAHHFIQNPKIHHRTADALARMGLVKVKHDLCAQWFEVTLVKEG